MAQPQGQTLFSALTDQTVRTDPPLLVSSWPYHGSKITLIGDNGLHGFGLSLLSGTLSDTRTLPIILYFNQAVKGISSSTVAIKSELLKEELVWKPLSMNNSNTAQVWVVYLNLANLELQLLKTYSVEINIGHSKGIVSSNGNHYGDPSQISFKVFVQTSYTELTEGQGGKRTTWMDTNLQKIDHFQESDSIVTADQNHHIPTSNWCTEEIVQEITKFQDLLSEYDCKIGRLTLARLLTALDMLSSQHDGRKSNTEEVLQLYTDMMKLDPTHSIYYKDECSLISLKRANILGVWPQTRRCSLFLRSSLLSGNGGVALNEWKDVPDICKSFAEKYGDKIALVDPKRLPQWSNNKREEDERVGRTAVAEGRQTHKNSHAVDNVEEVRSQEDERWKGGGAEPNSRRRKKE
ncbi:hypothetical protein JHK85_004082 [Glycine max]|nr:hypothetical protein JHK85_004082 [Glycine max]